MNETDSQAGAGAPEPAQEAQVIEIFFPKTWDCRRCSDYIAERRLFGACLWKRSSALVLLPPKGKGGGMNASAVHVQARLCWATIPADLKPSLTRLLRLGLLDQARPEILQEATAALKVLDDGVTSLDYCFSLEYAAKQWLADHGYGREAA